MTLGKIALSLSGGGYRAAAFHLGSLQMLHELDLLKDVKILSTVSGGSIAGAAYVASIAEGESFERFRSNFYVFLESTNVVMSALNGVRDTRTVNGESAMPSLIRAAAEIYDGRELYGGKTMGDVAPAKETIDELVINTTEFNEGGSFRFVLTKNPLVRSGNNSLDVPESVSSRVRIADAVAASSCFPSGFEPIRFPSDFIWTGNGGLTDIRQSLGPAFRPDVALMDGGIFDNQGIDSIRNIHSRKNSDIDLFIISDTSARRSKPFEFLRRAKSGFVPLWLWRLALIVLMLGSIGSALAAFVEAKKNYEGVSAVSLEFILIFVLPFLFSSAVALLIAHAFYRFRSLKAFVRRETGIELWACLRSLTVPEIIHLSTGRLASLIEMTTYVFMKRVRSMGFESVFADLGIREKLVPNLIYDIDNEERWGKDVRSNALEPKPALRSVAKRAESYKTNLWFLDSQDLDNLILCGRATVCFKLLKYLLRYKKEEIAKGAGAVHELYRSALSKWGGLNT